LELWSSLSLYETFIRAGVLSCSFGICGGANIESPRVLYLYRRGRLLLPAFVRLRGLLWAGVWLPRRILQSVLFRLLPADLLFVRQSVWVSPVLLSPRASIRISPPRLSQQPKASSSRLATLAVTRFRAAYRFLFGVEKVVRDDANDHRDKTTLRRLKVFDAPGVEPYFGERQQAIDYAESRTAQRKGEIRIVNAAGRDRRSDTRVRRSTGPAAATSL
jgi:hypothetical protein